MSKKNKKNKKPATATTPAKPAASRAFYTGPRVKRSWKERQALRVTRSTSMLTALSKSLERAGNVTPVNDNVFAELARLELALGAVADDFSVSKKQYSRSGIEIGSIVGVAEEHENDPIFGFMPVSLFEQAEVVAADGKQNWLVKCTDGATRTIRKALLEPVYAESDEEEETDDSDEAA